jgi:hypothetical protein
MSEQAKDIVGVVGARADGCEVVCTLPAASLAERVAMLEREILPHARSGARIADGFRLEFARDPGIRQRLERWAELERSCCREARFELEERGEALRLSVHGIQPAAGALAALLDAATAQSRDSHAGQ